MCTVEVSHPGPGVALVTLNRPDRLNTMNAELVRTLSAALTEINDDTDTRVVVLTGAGRGFCAGLDLRGYGADAPFDDSQHVIDVLNRQREIAQLAIQLHTLRQPVIAAVNGPAAGGGLALVCASDIRIAAEPALFAVSFIRAGFSACDIGISWLLPRIVGTGRAHELMLTGRRCPADEALRLGLVTDIVAPDALLDAAYAKAEEIMLNPPWSVELTKQGMWCSVENPSFLGAVELENRQQLLTSLTADRSEAAAAFLEKRPPVYQRR
jgi:enoyl-CoA hydratase/carnithine racemase